MPTNSTTRLPYTVQLIKDSGLSADQRAAAELRFRMALEFALGGAEYVVPSLQAYMLAQALNEPSEDDEADSQDQDETEKEDDGGAQQMIAFWEKAESDAIRAGLKPLGKLLAKARFEIVPAQN